MEYSRHEKNKQEIFEGNRKMEIDVFSLKPNIKNEE